MKVFVSAYACRPGTGSEEGSGWNLVCQIARLARGGRVWVATLPEHRAAIEAQLAQQPLPNVEFHYLDIPFYASTNAFVRRGAMGRFPHYLTWQVRAYRLARKLHREHGFDVTHHVTYAQYWTGSWLPLLPVPFVWGPVGGGEVAPRGFWRALDREGRRYERKRTIARAVLSRYPAAVLSARRSAVALAATHETAEAIRRRGARDVRILATTALPEGEYYELTNLPLAPDRPFRVLSVSRLEQWKALHLAIDAFARLRAQVPEATYSIIGEGPEEAKLRARAEQLGIASSVEFAGRRPRTEVFERLTRAQVFLHPSLHDSGGWAVTEAMAAGVAVVCLRLGGPGVQVTDRAGFAIEAGTPDQAVAGMADAMVRIAKEPELRQHVANAARARAGDFLWERVGDELAQLAPYQPRSTHS